MHFTTTSTEHGGVTLIDQGLGFAAIDGDLKACIIWLAKGANPNARLSKGNTALMLAAAAGRKDCLVALLSSGADPRVLNDAGETALLLATLAHLGDGGSSCAAPLVIAGSDVDHSGPRQRRAIHEAAWRADPEALVALLAYGADPNVRSEGGMTPLMEAAESGIVQNIYMLLSHGAHLEAVDDQGRTAEEWAEADAKPMLIAEREHRALALASNPDSLVSKARQNKAL